MAKALLGRVAALWRYPVKSMQGESLSRASLGPSGIPGDRGWALRGPGLRSPAGSYGSAKQLAALLQCSARFAAPPVSGRMPPPAAITLPDGRTLSAEDPETAAALSAWLGRPVSLHPAQTGHFDSKPLHLLNQASLQELQRRRPGSRFEARRFRPNLMLDCGPGQPFSEKSWLGRRLKVGAAVLAVLKPTRRCVMVTHAQPGLERDAVILKELFSLEIRLGVYARVERSGEVSVGDSVELHD